jgi:hypothetical protein
MSVMRARALGLLVLACLSTCARPSRADDKKECADAYVSAQSLRAEHKLLAARAQLRICARPQCEHLMQGQLIKDCTTWLGEVEASLPTVVLSARDAGGNELQNVKVSIDGTEVAQVLDGRAIEIEPGSHVFAFADAQGASVTQTAVILEGTRNQTIQVTVGSAQPPAPAPPPPTIPPPFVPPPEPEPPASQGSPLRVIGLATGGVGIAALASAGVFALLASSAKSDYLQHCGSNIDAPPSYCDPTGIRGHTDAVNKANASTGLLVGGGALLAAGAVLFFVAPHGSSAPQVGVGPGGFVVRGGF